MTSRDVNERTPALPELALLAHSIRCIGESVIITDRHNVILFVNDAFQKMYGYDRDEVTGKSISCIRVHREGEETVERVFQQTLRGGWKGEVTNRRKDGTEFPISLTTSAIRDEQGEVIAMIGIVQDVTERKKAELAIRQSEARYRTTIDAIGDSIHVVDADLRIVLVNEGFRRWNSELGLETEAVGKTIFEIFPFLPAKVREEYRQVFESGRGITSEGRDVVGGEEFFTETCKMPLFEGARVVNVVTVIHNITERRRSEEALRQSEQLHRSLIEALPDGIAVADVTGNITFASPRMLSIYGAASTDEAIGTNALDWIAPESRAKALANILALLDNRISSDNEYVLLRKDGSSFIGEINGVRLTDPEGNPKGMVTVHRDVTQRRRDAEALKVSEESLRTFMNALPDQAFLVDVDGICLAVNEALARRLKRTPAELIGKCLYHFLPAHRARQWESLIGQAIRTAGPLQFEDAAEDGDFAYYIRPVLDESGRVARIAVFALDTTEQKQAHQEIMLLAQALMSSRDCITITDLHDNIVFVNDALLSTYGYKEEELIGKSILTLRPQKTDRDLLGEALPEKLVSDWHRELMNRRKDGTEFPVEIWSSVVQDESGAAVAAVGVARDITERRMAEQALRQSEERYREFFEQDLTGDFISTADGRILECNPAFARMYGFSSVEEAKATNAASLYPSTESRAALHDRLRKEKKLEYLEVEARRIDGKPLYVVENLIGVFDESGEMTHVRGYIFDNTERKILEGQLFHSQKMESIGRLASGIAHDFNNVLNNILGFSHQLKKNFGDVEKVIRYSESIEKSAIRGATLAGQLLSFVRKKKHESVPTNLVAIIQEIVHLASEIFPKSLSVETDVDPALKNVLGDRGELYQAVFNLVLNARDAIVERGDTPVPGQIRITAATRQTSITPPPFFKDRFDPQLTHWIDLRVVDNGVGVPQKIRDKIFDPFFTTKERGTGAGLGLSIVYNIVQNHNGSISVESEMGAGSTFRISLPALAGEPIQEESGKEELATQPGNGLILLVDDEEMMQDLGKELLEGAGYNVLIAGNGFEALDRYRENGNEISLVILDLVMPRMDGAKAYVELKKLNPTVKAFFCTGYAQDKTIELLMEQEHVRALQKPFNPPQLLNMVREVLNEGSVKDVAAAL